MQAPSTPPPPVFTAAAYRDFMATLRSDESADVRTRLQTHIAQFNKVDIPELLRRGEETPGSITTKILQGTLASMRRHPVWEPRFSTADGPELVAECLEKVILTNVYDNAFCPTGGDARMDTLLAARITSLTFLQPAHFDIPAALHTPAFEKHWEAAQHELARMDGFKAPRDKMVCVQNACRILFGLLSTCAAMGKTDATRTAVSAPVDDTTADSSPPGSPSTPSPAPSTSSPGSSEAGAAATTPPPPPPPLDGATTDASKLPPLPASALASADDFLPTLICAVLRANPPRLHSNLAFVREYRDPSQFSSELGYCFTHLMSAVQFIQRADASLLSISDEEFEAGLTAHTPAGFPVGFAAATTPTPTAPPTTPPPAPPTTTAAAAAAPASPPALPDAAAGPAALLSQGSMPAEALAQCLHPPPSGASPQELDKWCTARFQFVSTPAADLKLSDVHTLVEEYRNLVKTCAQLLRAQGSTFVGVPAAGAGVGADGGSAAGDDA